MISFMVQVSYPNVTGNTMVRHGSTGRHFINKKYDVWRKELRAELEGRGVLPEEPHKQPCHVNIVARPPDARARDCDNLMKVVFDGLVYCGLIADDSNKILRSVRLEWAAPEKGEPGRLSIMFTGAAEV